MSTDLPDLGFKADEYRAHIMRALMALLLVATWSNPVFSQEADTVFAAKENHPASTADRSVYRADRSFFRANRALSGADRSIYRSDRPLFSVGVLVGPSSGLAFKALLREPAGSQLGRSSDLHLSFNGQGYAKIAAHSLKERPFPEAPLVLYLGPGMLAELDDGSLRWGLSGMIGAYFVKGPYEVLLQLMPRLLITPRRDGGYSAAVGLRYRL